MSLKSAVMSCRCFYEVCSQRQLLARESFLVSCEFKGLFGCQVDMFRKFCY